MKSTLTRLALAAGTTKRASAAVPARMVREFAPVSDRREDFTPRETEGLEEGKSQWLPELIQTDATKIPAMMASPGRQSLLAGGAGAAAGGGIGALIGSHMGSTAGGAGVGALAGGALAALARYVQQRRGNDHIEEAMRRLPPEATKRDYDVEELLSQAIRDRFKQSEETEKSAAPNFGGMWQAGARAIPRVANWAKSVMPGVKSFVTGAREVAPEIKAVAPEAAAFSKNFTPGMSAAARSSAVFDRAKSVANAGYQNTPRPTWSMFAKNPASTLTGAVVGDYAAGQASNNPDSNWYDPSRLAAGMGGAAIGGYGGRAAGMLPTGLRSSLNGALQGAGAGYVYDYATGDGTPGRGMALGAAGGSLLGNRWLRNLIPGFGAGGRAVNQFNRGVIGNNGVMDAFQVPGEARDVFNAARGAGRYAEASPWQRLTGVGIGGKARRLGQAVTAGGALAAGGTAAGNYVQDKVEHRLSDQMGYDTPEHMKSDLSQVKPMVEAGRNALEHPEKLIHMAGNALSSPEGQAAVEKAIGMQPGQLAQVKQHMPKIMQMLQGGGHAAASAMGFMENMADKILGTLGMDVASMSGIQKAVILLGGLGLIGGAVTGSKTLGALGGVALGAGVLPRLLPGRVPDYWGGGQAPRPWTPQLGPPSPPAVQQQPQQQPQQSMALSPTDGIEGRQ